MDTIAVPRETLERWRKVAADAVEIGLTRRVDYLADEIGRVLAQPVPVEDGFCGPEPPTVTTTDAPSPVTHTRLPDDDLVWREKTAPHTIWRLEDGTLLLDEPYQFSHAFAPGQGVVIQSVSYDVVSDLPDSEGNRHLIVRREQPTTAPHKWQEGMLGDDGSVSSRWHRWTGTEWSPLVTRAEVQKMLEAMMTPHLIRDVALLERVAKLELAADMKATKMSPTPNCLNWSIGEGWCVHGLKPCSVGCSFKVPREVKG